MALECRYCLKNGHTVKYCPVLKEKEKEQKRNNMNKQVYIIKEEPVSKGKSNNAFACLDCESDEDVEDETEKVEKFPELTTNIYQNKRTSLLNYAAALAKPMQIKIQIPMQEPEVNIPKKKETITSVIKPEPVVKAAPWSTTTEVTKSKWTAWDSDEEDDYVEDENNDAWD